MIELRVHLEMRSWTLHLDHAPDLGLTLRTGRHLRPDCMRFARAMLRYLEDLEARLKWSPRIDNDYALWSYPRYQKTPRAPTEIGGALDQSLKAIAAMIAHEQPDMIGTLKPLVTIKTGAPFGPPGAIAHVSGAPFGKAYPLLTKAGLGVLGGMLPAVGAISKSGDENTDNYRIEPLTFSTGQLASPDNLLHVLRDLAKQPDAGGHAISKSFIPLTAAAKS